MTSEKNAGQDKYPKRKKIALGLALLGLATSGSALAASSFGHSKPKANTSYMPSRPKAGSPNNQRWLNSDYATDLEVGKKFATATLGEWNKNPKILNAVLFVPNSTESQPGSTNKTSCFSVTPGYEGKEFMVGPSPDYGFMLTYPRIGIAPDGKTYLMGNGQDFAPGTLKVFDQSKFYAYNNWVSLDDLTAGNVRIYEPASSGLGGHILSGEVVTKSEESLAGTPQLEQVLTVPGLQDNSVAIVQFVPESEPQQVLGLMPAKDQNLEHFINS